MNHTILRFFLVTLVLLALPVNTFAEEKAKLPYSVVNGYLELFKSLEGYDRIIPSMMIVSTNPKIAPPSIELKITTADGWQSFNPNETGIIEFPDKPEWSDLTLISNQPKGTLQMAIAYSARPLTSTSMSYQELMGIVPQFQAALSALAAKQGQPPPKIRGLTVQLPEGSNAAVRILSPKAKQTMKAYATGITAITYSDALWQENPAVEFDVIPIGIVPLQ